MFKQMIDNLSDSPNANRYRTITPEEYMEFERQWVFYILQEKRYGQAFCEHFGLNIYTPLHHFKDEEISRRWIKELYLK
jgi:hypothetical protein